MLLYIQNQALNLTLNDISLNCFNQNGNQSRFKDSIFQPYKSLIYVSGDRASIYSDNLSVMNCKDSYSSSII